MKKHLSTIVLAIAFTAGLLLLLYPSVSNFVNSLHQTKAIQDYTKAVSNIEKEEYEKLLQEAKDYNKWLQKEDCGLALPEEDLDRYNSVLDISGTGVMGYIEIESIGVSLPIYHGTSKDVLQEAVGHINGSSLPVGGEGMHTVLSGHRGLPSAKLFTRLDEMEPGDTFVLRIMNETLTYQVDQIKTVLPSETTDLQMIPGEDHCTLVTCTPYGVNSHRLLVRGTRTDNAKEKRSVFVVNEAVRIDPLIVTPVFAAPVLLILLVVLLVRTRNPKGKKMKKDGQNKKRKKNRKRQKKQDDAASEPDTPETEQPEAEVKKDPEKENT